MKPIPTLLIAVTLTAVACKKEGPVLTPEQPVGKDVEYHIFTSNDYTDPLLDDVKADLRLQIRKINYKTGEHTLLWDSVFTTRQLRNFPDYDNKIVVQKTFAVKDSHEKLNGSYSVVYNKNGLIQQEGRGKDAYPGKSSILLEADL